MSTLNPFHAITTEAVLTTLALSATAIGLTIMHYRVHLYSYKIIGRVHAREALYSIDAVGDLGYGETQDDDDDDVDEKPTPHEPPVTIRRWRFAGVVARCVKVKMGIAKDTPANRIVAWELCGKELKDRNVRKCDVAMYQSLASALVFVPTKWDVDAANVMRSKPISWRFREMEGPPGFWKWLWGNGVAERPNRR